MPRQAPTKAKSKRGLSPQTFKGVNKKRIEQRTGSGKRVAFGKDDDATVTLQFLQSPEDFLEFETHAFQEDGRWNFVPCAGEEDCPLCADEDEKVRNKGYRFAVNVYNTNTEKVQILEGPVTLVRLIFLRYQRKTSVFLKRVFDVTKFPTKPTSYGFDTAEEAPVSVRGKKLYDLEEYLLDEMKRYYGDDLDLAASDLRDDDDDEDDDEDDLDDEDEDEDDLDDEDDDEDDDDEDDDEDDDDDDDDEDDDDEDEDEDDEPAPRKRVAKKVPVKRAPAKRAPAKRAVAKRAPAKRAVAKKTTRR